MRKISKKLKELEGREVALVAATVGSDKKAEDIVILDVRGISSFADYFVIMSGRSTRHVQGLADAVDQALGNKRLKKDNIEGLNEGHWVLLDYNDVVVHIFYQESRGFYDLEGLWRDAPRLDITDGKG